MKEAGHIVASGFNCLRLTLKCQLPYRHPLTHAQSTYKQDRGTFFQHAGLTQFNDTRDGCRRRGFAKDAFLPGHQRIGRTRLFIGDHIDGARRFLHDREGPTASWPDCRF